MDYIHIAVGVSLIIAIYYYYLTKNYGYWKERCVPYLKDYLPGLGNTYPMFFLRQNIFQMFEEFYDRMPGLSMIGFYFGREPALLIRDPELVKSVLQLEFPSFNSNATLIDPKIDRLLSKNPFFAEGELWKASRQQLSFAYTSGKLKRMYELIDNVCKKLTKYTDSKIEKGNGEVDLELKTLFAKYTAEVISSAAFGIEGNSFRDDKEGTFVELGRAMFEPTFTKALKQLAVIFVPFIAKISNAGIIPARVDKAFRNIIKDMLKYREDHNVQRPDFLQLMISLKKSGASDYNSGGEFDDETLTSHSASFFIEGYETSSITASFVAYQLAKHPEIQQRLRDEVLNVANKHNGITYEALQEMTYMEQVIYETMRLFPPGGALMKICTNEVQLKGSDGIVCRVEPGTTVVISVCGIHKDPKYWSDPEKFDPDRFSEENKRNRHRFTYLTFGEGPRVCIGIRVAMLQVKAALATTIEKYTLEPSSKTQEPIKMNPYYFMPSALGGLWAKIKPLQPTKDDS